MLWQLAADPRTPVVVAEPEPLVRAVAHQFRMAENQYAGDRRISEIAALLRADAPGHQPLWECRGVGAFGAPAAEVTGTPSRAHLLLPSGQPGGAVLVLAADAGVTG